MKILDLSLHDRSLFYVNVFIVPALERINFQVDDYDKKQFVDLILDALIDSNKFTQQLASDLGHYAKNWNLDWHWIAFHIIWDSYNIRRAKEIINSLDGYESIVYKKLEKFASPKSRQLYLTNPNDLRSEPKSFYIKDLIANGTNLGKPPNELKPVFGVTDFGFYEIYDGNSEKEIFRYWDHSSLIEKPSGYIWDRERQRFLPPPNRKVKRKSKLRVTTKDENGHLVDMNDFQRKQNSIRVKGEAKRKCSWWEKLFGMK